MAALHSDGSGVCHRPRGKDNKVVARNLPIYPVSKPAAGREAVPAEWLEGREALALPDWALTLAEGLHGRGLMPRVADLLTAHEYEPVQEINAHVELRALLP